MYGFHLRQQASVLEFQIYVQELRHILGLNQPEFSKLFRSFFCLHLCCFDAYS